jgi:hypothetical protein
MGLFNKMFGWLKKSHREHVSTNPFLNPLDLNELNDELRVSYEARRMGEVGLPANTDTMLSGVEAQIKHRVEASRSNSINWANQSLLEIQKKLTNYDITKVVNHALGAAGHFENQANGILNDNQAMLNNVQSKVVNSSEYLRLFRLENNLSVQAVTPSIVTNALLTMLAVLIVMIEGVLNANFFAASLDGGFIEGFMYAFLLALINVLNGVCFGRFGIPFINHVHAGKRLVGWLSMLACATIMLGIALITTHLRNSFSLGLNTDTAQAAAHAWDSMLTAPFAFGDIFSMLLFFVSIFFGLFSAFKGYFWSDSYPGYAGVQRASDAAADEYEVEVARVRAELEELKNTHLEQLEADLEGSRLAIVDYKNQIDQKRATEHSLNILLDKAKAILDALINMFRGDNKLYRKNVDVPAYFNNSVALDEVLLPNFDTTENNKALAVQERLFRRFLSEVESIRTTIMSSFNLKFDQLKPFREQL